MTEKIIQLDKQVDIDELAYVKTIKAAPFLGTDLDARESSQRPSDATNDW